MSSSFEKSVKGATKIKAAPPKTKYIEHILIATHSGEAGVGEIFRALQFRLRDSTWTVVLKSLITIHLMIREGSPDATLGYLAKHRTALAISSFTDAQIQGRNIRHYAGYLAERVRAFRETGVDWVRGKETRLEKLSVEKGLLRQTEVVQHQLTALLKCDVLEDPENEITITVFRLLVLDLLSLFQVLNQAMINLLGHFFEMSKVDAERALGIYQNFTKQTDYVVQYLSVARQWEPHTRVEVPKLKHAPVTLRRQLVEYLEDPDFETHRRQYLAELDAKKGGTGLSSKTDKGTTDSKSTAAKAKASAASTSGAPAQTSKGPDPDLIDFFDSIEQNQTSMAVHPNNQPQHQIGQVNQPMPTGNPWPSNDGFAVQQTGQLQANGFVSQPTGFQPNNSPFQQQNVGAFSQQQQVPNQMQPSFTGAGFGGFTPQPQPSFTPNTLPPIPQDSAAPFQPGTLSPPMQTGMQTGLQPGLMPGQQITNPFRASMLMANPTGMPNNSFGAPTSPQTQATSLTRQNTNPFARSSPQAVTPFQNPPSTSPFLSQPPQAPVQAPLQSATTGTNPFARNFSQTQNLPQAQPTQPQRPQTSSGLMPQPTGSTNPFRQGAFVNHQTGMGWQHGQQPLGGGLDHMETMPVFPRPATQTPWQQ
ncbi:ANTH-domain-containing protein [Annulohypoxylon maeteangense]|uniref:ANTH-domain-containing protein n=1 Tax=Annulohypoxylon maeteangense TaxID=1927788 RepID=UPI0020084B2D|nr:ANTH-domain-containing protein [Annulohypoxylon maeteangense]KAI0881586.1 ANTH-domain-containing protein [Annulohypoxylon maeteangense]